MAASVALLFQGVTDKMHNTAVPLVQEEEAAESPAESPSRLPARKGRGEKGAKAAAGASLQLSISPWGAQAGLCCRSVAGPCTAGAPSCAC